MPDVTGRIVQPSGTAGSDTSIRTRFRLVDSAGNHVTQAWDTSSDRLIVDQEDFGLDAQGDYTVTLAPNTQIEPSGTRWSRIVLVRGKEFATKSLVVPVGGGPYTEQDIYDEIFDALPTTEPSNELDVAEITSNQTLGSFNGFNIIAVTGATVTVPTLTRPVYVEAQLWMEHAATANANLGVAVAAVGSTTIGQQKALAMGFVGAAGKECTPFVRARLPANSPGDYQMFGYSDTSGNVTAIASAANPGRITVLAV